MKSPVEAVTHPDPYPWYASLVAERPFYFDAGLACWVASGAAAVAAVLAEPAGRVRPAAEPVPKGIDGTAAGAVFGSLVRMTDGDLHDRLKAIVVEALGTVDAGTVADVASERARKHLGGGTADLDALMFSVPCEVVAILCGLDDGAAEEATRLAGEFVQCLPASATPDQQAAAARAAAALRELMGPRLDGGEAGLLGELLHAAARSDWQETAPLLANGIGFLSQTYDATAGLIGNTLVALRRGETPDGDLTPFVREVARHDSPVHTTRRFAASSFEVAGERVEEGQSVLLLLGAANRDPSANPHPDAFDTEREAPVLFTFGAAGHGCPGATLAVAVAAAVVGELLGDGFDPASLPARFTYRPSANVRVPVLVPAADPEEGHA